mmetsp:Transcript_1750/g.3423  ORF Transcript_1750/g.3423 Transcript_1750/m.3423 type:complete len:366 (+) Transcript_1750:356-1453(+)
MQDKAHMCGCRHTHVLSGTCHILSGPYTSLPPLGPGPPRHALRTSFVIILVVWQERRHQSKPEGHGVKPQHRHAQAHANGHAPQVRQNAPAANDAKDLVGQGVWLGCMLVGRVEHVKLGDFDFVAAPLGELGVDGAGLDRVDMDAPRPGLHCQGCCKLGDGSLREAVAHSKGIGDEAGSAGREHNRTLQLLLYHKPIEVVGQVYSGREIAVEVGQVLLDGLVVEKPCEDVAGIVEQQLNVDVFRGRLHILHPSSSPISQITAHLPELPLRMRLLQFLKGCIQDVVTQGDKDDVDALVRQFLCNGLANATGTAGYHCPLCIILLLQVLGPKEPWERVENCVGGVRQGKHQNDEPVPQEEKREPQEE